MSKKTKTGQYIIFASLLNILGILLQYGWLLSIEEILVRSLIPLAALAMSIFGITETRKYIQSPIKRNVALFILSINLIVALVMLLSVFSLLTLILKA
jgi:heme O synthase-like polyprenyltransferase